MRFEQRHQPGVHRIGIAGVVTDNRIKPRPNHGYITSEIDWPTEQVVVNRDHTIGELTGVASEPCGESARMEARADHHTAGADGGAKHLSHHAVQQCVGQRMAMARNVVAPFAGEMHGREGDHGALVRTRLAAVPAHRPVVLDETARLG